MEETRWHLFQQAAHHRAGSPTAQRTWARSLGEEELAFYATRAAGWVAVTTQPSAFSVAADRHHSAVSELADACIEVYAATTIE